MTTAEHHSEQETPVFVGISFGTLNSCIAIGGKKPGTGEAIADEDGDRIIPSVVAYTGHGEVLAGTQAKQQARSNPTGTIVQFRSLLGKKFNDPTTKDLAARLAMNIVAGQASMPAYETQVSSEDPDAGEEEVTQTHSVVQVTAKYLTKLRETAETVLGRKVNGVVLSSPQHFEESEKKALLDASLEAGFAHTYTVHEPVAAAMAFQAAPHGHSSTDKLILVLDLGGHQFNTTVLSYNDGVYTSLASLDDHALGGVQFDEVLVAHIKEEFRKKSKCDISDNRRAMNKLRAACEVTKRSLTRQEVVPCSIESLYDGMDFSLNVNRARFEAMADPLFTRLASKVRESLTKAQITPAQVAEVLLVGGASRMPRFQSVVKSIFSASPNTVIRMDVEPDEAIALGCSIQAQLIAPVLGEYTRALGSKELLSVPQLAHAIGVVDAKGAVVELIPVHAPLPARRTFEFGLSPQATSAGAAFIALQECVEGGVNTPLAQLVLSDLPAATSTSDKKSACAVSVTLTVERDYTLSVSAKCSGTTGSVVRCKIAPSSSS